MISLLYPLHAFLRRQSSSLKYPCNLSDRSFPSVATIRNLKLSLRYPYTPPPLSTQPLRETTFITLNCTRGMLRRLKCRTQNLQFIRVPRGFRALSGLMFDSLPACCRPERHKVQLNPFKLFLRSDFARHTSRSKHLSPLHSITLHLLRTMESG